MAWFAPGIPIPNGPWKFGGLPGLILKLYDTDENFIFECDGIEYLKEKEPIKFYKLEYVRLKRKELNKLYQRFHEDVGAYTESKGSKLHLSGGGILSLPYNPIELE
ncbi:GLPGLI family protein [Bacteroidales bacterium OttesenSCG-928-I14]|nr:GLPGLI family protein [Bacteroidales bacterium OttesenSCG-928-I14]